MSAFSKKYTTPDNPDSLIFLTWESGFKNLKVYHNGRLLTTVDSPSALDKGFYFEDETAGHVRLNYVGSKKQSIAVSIDGLNYYPDKDVLDKNALYGTSGVFWVLFGLSLLGTLIVFIGGDLIQNRPGALIETIINLVIVIIFGISAYFTRKGMGWAYFLGTATFLLATLLNGYAYNLIGWSTVFIIIMGVRLFVLVFLLTFIKRALIAVRFSGQEDGESNELLDSLD